MDDSYSYFPINIGKNQGTKTYYLGHNTHKQTIIVFYIKCKIECTNKIVFKQQYRTNDVFVRKRINCICPEHELNE